MPAHVDKQLLIQLRSNSGASYKKCMEMAAGDTSGRLMVDNVNGLHVVTQLDETNINGQVLPINTVVSLFNMPVKIYVHKSEEEAVSFHKTAADTLFSGPRKF